MKIDAGSIKKGFRLALVHLYTMGEIDHLYRIFFEHITTKSALGIKLSSFHLSAKEAAAFDAVLKDLISGKPYQYVIGSVPFADIELRVAPGVLIPRPETEELVELIKSEMSREEVSSILDLGTGSGCIALALANHYTKAQITAVDSSKKALAIASENALYNKLDLYLREFDILNGNHGDLIKADIIVSNPPYIAQKESQHMSSMVLEHEPEIALFVPNDDPLLFYRKIGELAKPILNPKGRLYFELNTNYAEDTRQLFKSAGWQTRLYNDLSGNKRFLKAWA